MKYAFRLVCRETRFHLSLVVSVALSFCGVAAFSPEQTIIKSHRRPRIRDCRTGMSSKRKDQADDEFKLTLSDIEFDLVPSICDISQEDWDSCLSLDSSPFMQHSWLRCLEESGCASAETGWMPSHVAIRSGERACGFVPVSVAPVEPWPSKPWLSKEGCELLLRHSCTYVTVSVN